MLFQETAWALSCSEETETAETCRRSALGSVLGVTIVPAQGYGAAMRGGGRVVSALGVWRRQLLRRRLKTKISFSP